MMSPYLDGKPRSNLHEFSDMLYSGFGKQPVQPIWNNPAKIQIYLGLTVALKFYEDKINQGKPYNVKWAQQKLTDLENG